MNCLMILAQNTVVVQPEPPSPIVIVIALGLGIVVIAGMWKVFTKAGQPGWGVLIPIYNVYLLLKVAQKPGWWLLLFFIPIVNLIIGILVAAAISRNFGRGVGTTLGLIFLPWLFYPILGFGSAQYMPQDVPQAQGFPVTPSNPAMR